MKKLNYFFNSLFLIKFFIIFPSIPLLADSFSVESWFNKVVLINSYQQSYDWISPWEKRGIRKKNGMALIVNIDNSKNKHIFNKSSNNSLLLLTTAEIVANATLIEITRKGYLKPFIAKISNIDFAANIALLKVENLEFWKDLKPVNWGKLKNSKQLKSKSIKTLKIKSAEEWHLQSAEIEQMTVGHRIKTNAWFPQIKISSLSKIKQGFPVIQDNKTVGMINESGNGGVGAIPSELILEFFKHSKNKEYHSLAHRGFIWKKLPQKSTADFFKIPYENPGIWISKVLPYGTGSDVLIKGDYLTKIGEWGISHEGKINHPTWGLSPFDLIFLDKLKTGDTTLLKVIRNGKQIILKAKVTSFKDLGRKIPLNKLGAPPRYIIMGGFLFQELSLNYLYMWGKNWKTRAPIRLRMFLEENNSIDINKNNNKINFKDKNFREVPGSKIVLVTQVIPDQINIGYQKISNAIVVKINDKKILKLKDVKDAFLNHNGNFHRIDFLPGSNRLSAILPVNGLIESNERIKNNFRIPKLQSF